MSGGNCWTANHHQPVIFSSHTFRVHSCFISILCCTFHFRFARNTSVGRHQKNLINCTSLLHKSSEPHITSQCCRKRAVSMISSCVPGIWNLSFSLFLPVYHVFFKLHVEVLCKHIKRAEAKTGLKGHSFPCSSLRPPQEKVNIGGAGYKRVVVRQLRCKESTSEMSTMDYSQQNGKLT